MNALDMIPWIVVAINITLLSLVFGIIIHDVFCYGYGLPKFEVVVKTPQVAQPRNRKINLYEEESL